MMKNDNRTHSKPNTITASLDINNISHIYKNGTKKANVHHHMEENSLSKQFVSQICT